MSFLNALFFALSAARSDESNTSLYSNNSGNITSMTGDNDVNDNSGNTTGNIGRQNVSLYTGSIQTALVIPQERSAANQYTYTDQFGNATGSAGQNDINLFTNKFGNTTGN